MSQNAWYPSDAASSSVTASQGNPNTLANAWPVKVTDGTDLALVNGSGELLVAISSTPLPSGAATAAKQDIGNTSLASIDSKVATETTLNSLNGKVTAVDTGAVVISSSALPSGASTSANQTASANKTGSSDVTVAYDYRSISYISTTQKIDTIVYKTGGSGGTTVATQTFGYDGSDRLTSITKT